MYKRKYVLNPEETQTPTSKYKPVTAPDDDFGLTVEPNLSFSLSSCNRIPGNCNDRFIPSRKSDRMKNYIEGIPNENDFRDNEPETVAQLYRAQVLKLNTVKNFEYGHTPLDKGFEVGKYIKHLNKSTNEDLKKVRKIQKAPFKVLDAPALQDDFYLNLIDWSQ